MNLTPIPPIPQRKWQVDVVTPEVRALFNVPRGLIPGLRPGLDRRLYLSPTTVHGVLQKCASRMRQFQMTITANLNNEDA
jgi:hypothetical protein